MEILAPCGSPRHIIPAVYCGADAVYLGARALSARAGAENFTKPELREAVELCHTHGVRVYQTVNTLLRDGELDLLRQVFEDAAEARVDALIIQDWGVARLARECLPDMELHGSTQTSIHTPAGIRLAGRLGFSRVVLARELTAGQIKEIADSAPLGVEVFVHGALCVSVSGQCLMSAMLGGRSGNRGQCAQPCRLDFQARGGNHALSLKDMSLVQRVAELRGAGATALKIEGRMKRPEYVAAAVTAVRAALDGGEPDMASLEAVFSRSGFTCGCFTGDMRDMGGTRRREDVLAAKPVLSELERLYKAPVKRIVTDMSVSVTEGLPVSLTASAAGMSVTVRGEASARAINQPLTSELLSRQLSKLGGTQYEPGALSADIAPGLALPVSAINELRRRAVIAMDAERLCANTPVRRPPEPFPALPDGRAGGGMPRLRAECRTAEQWLRVREQVWQGTLPLGELSGQAEALSGDADRLLISPPRFLAGEEQRVRLALEALYGMGYRRLLCQNAGHVELGRELGYILHGGFGLNVTNSFSALELEAMGLCDLTLSPELKLSQGVRSSLALGRVAYGRLPLMLLARCPARGGRPTGGCPDCGPLTDRLGKAFPLRCDGNAVELLNADTLWMADRLPELAGLDFIALLFDREKEPERIVRAHLDGGAPPEGYTRGLLYRGVT